MFNKLKQLKNLREQAKKIQTQLARETLEFEKDGLRIVIDGNQEISSYSIEDTSLLNLGRKDELETRLKQATNEAIKKAQKMMAEKMMKEGGFGLPGF